MGNHWTDHNSLTVMRSISAQRRRNRRAATALAVDDSQPNNHNGIAFVMAVLLFLGIAVPMIQGALQGVVR